MNSYADKTKQSQSQSVANAMAENQQTETTPFQLKDNRSQSKDQLKVQSQEQPIQRFLIPGPNNTKRNPTYSSSHDRSKEFKSEEEADAYDRKLEAEKNAAATKTTTSEKDVAPEEEKTNEEVVSKPKPTSLPIDDRTKARGVKLGKGHKHDSKKVGKRKTTEKVEERATRHMMAAIRGESSKARVVGKKGNNISWELDRAKKEKQERKGPRHILQHRGGGGDGDPLDYFEDQDYGAMSDTDSESDSESYSD